MTMTRAINYKVETFKLKNRGERLKLYKSQIWSIHSPIKHKQTQQQTSEN